MFSSMRQNKTFIQLFLRFTTSLLQRNSASVFVFDVIVSVNVCWTRFFQVTELSFGCMYRISVRADVPLIVTVADR